MQILRHFLDYEYSSNYSLNILFVWLIELKIIILCRQYVFRQQCRTK